MINWQDTLSKAEPANVKQRYIKHLFEHQTGSHQIMNQNSFHCIYAGKHYH